MLNELLYEGPIKSKYIDSPKVRVCLREYIGQTLAIVGISEVEGPLFTATVNLIDYGIVPQDGHVLIRADRESEGLYESLLKAKVIGKRIAEYSYGYANKCKAFECPVVVWRESK